MRYLVLLVGYAAGTPDWSEMPPEQQQEFMERHDRFGRVCSERAGVEIVAAEALGDGTTATTMRTGPGGEVVLTDGPFAEAVEQLGGFYLLDVPDLDVLVEVLGELPPYVLELRPVVDI